MSDYTPTTWAEELLRRMGLPSTRANVSALVAWQAAEGGHWHNGATYNPLNTTEKEPGAHPMNSVGVEAYTSWDEGFTATIDTLRNGRYGPILAALSSGKSAVDVARAVAATPWGTGTGVLRALGQHTAPDPPGYVPPPLVAPPPGSSSGGGGGGGAAQPAAMFPGGNWDPLNWFSGPLSSASEKAAGVLVGGAERLMFTGTALALGAALVVIGAWRAFTPLRQKVESTLTNVAGAASAVPK